MRKSTLAGAIAFSLLSLNVHALSVGNLQVDSHLGEPLNLSIDLDSIDENEFSTLDVSLATREMFRLAGIEYPVNAKKLSVELGPLENGKAMIKVKTAGAVSDPFVHLLLSINWSGGNILREYTALIDPVDYTPPPIAQAVSPATSVGVSKPETPPTERTDAALFHTVKKGDSLSAIAALYRPKDVSIQQAWMAFFEINRDAFPDGNLNNIASGTRLQVPSDEQLRALPQSQAMQEVKRMTRPLKVAKSGDAVPGSRTQQADGPTLVVGGEGATASLAPEKMPAKTPETAQSGSDAMQLSDLGGYDQLSSIVTELGDFTNTIKQEINESRDRDVLLKEELIAARGENRVLTDRMARLEAQISKMSELLELQSNALQAMNTGGGVTQQAAPGLTLNKMEPATSASTPETATEQAPVPAPAVAAPAVEQSAAEAAAPAKTYYEQLLDDAISDAPKEDLSYIEEVLGQSSTSIGLQDANPVTAEMQAQAAASKPAAPAADQATEDMLANVRASLGNLTDTAAPIGEVEITKQDIDYLDALNEEDRSQIQKSEAKIAQLERELQERIKAAQSQPASPPAEEQTAPQQTESVQQEKTEPAAEGDQNPAMNKPVRVEPAAGDSAGLMSTLSGLVKSLANMLGGIGSDIWALIGGVGAAVIALFVMLGLRKRNTDEQPTEQASGSSMNIPLGDDSIEQDVADIATKSMQHEPEEGDLEEELHGSSLFDLSDESFMASEAIQDDSSLFSMDDNDDMDSLTEMDSAQIGGGQSAMTQAVDVDPIAEAEVYLAYDRKEQAIEVLEQSLSKEPNQSAVVIKLLDLYRDSENIEGFTRLFESSAEHIEDDDDWNKIKTMAQEFVPGHEMLADDFDSSIPVLSDEVVADTTPVPEVEELAASGLPDLAFGSDDDELPGLDEVDDIEDDESLNLSLKDDEAPDLELEQELDSAVEEVNQHEPDTALALAKAYIELGETDIAKDFLLDVINGNSEELKAEAEEMLASLG